MNKGTATTGNKHLGAPCNVRDEACTARSQPPFLLRWPPRQLSEFLPDVFAWEEASNRLSLREQHRSSPPWKAKPHHRRADASEQWLYCSTCHGTLFDTKEKEGQGAIPFRDSASLASVRGVECAAGVLAPDEGWERATAEAAKANPREEDL